MNTYQIKKKEDFSRVFRSGNYFNCNSFTINYATKIALTDKNFPRYGIVTSKKIGNAVKRNFAKRRAKALKNVFLNFGKNELDYILVVKKKLISEKFKILSSQLEEALNQINKKNHE
tara:strand:- start:173 stop:523 length:351 start_codon:yes stop_codon:yes gene_type:complete